MDTVASRLTKARTLRGLTQTELAAASRVKQGTIGNIEAGIRGGLNSLAPIAIALRVSYWWLRDGEGDMELPYAAWPFSPELADAVKHLDAEAVRRAENQLRAHLDIQLIEKPSIPPRKQASSSVR